MPIRNVALIALVSVSLVLCGFLFARGVRRAKTSPGRSLFWFFGTLMGLSFSVLSVFCSRLPPPGSVLYQPRDQVIVEQVLRLSALSAGVFFAIAVLSQWLIWSLDRLEQRSFISFIGARHVRAAKSGFLTIISLLSILGVAKSSFALCGVTSIMGGFGNDLKRKILGNNAHVIVDVTRPGGFGDSDTLLQETRLAIAKAGGAATPVVAGEAMASSSTNTAGALVRGIDSDTIGQVIDLRSNIEAGRFEYLTEPEKLIALPENEIIGRSPKGEPFLKGPDFSTKDLDPTIAEFLRKDAKIYPSVILGRELAKSLHVLVGDEVSLLSPLGELGPTGIMPRSRTFRVAGIFYSGMYEYDASHAYVTMQSAQDFFSMGTNISEIDIRVPEPEHVGEVRPLVEAVMAGRAPENAGRGAELRIRDWKEMNKNLFSALALERIATFIILCIAIAVASFCILCTLLLMVTEKGKEIAILKALGASDGAVLRIFVLEGIIIGGIGTAFGVVTALALCTGLSWFGVRLDPEVYYIERLPVSVSATDYVLVALASICICTLATLYPAFAASKLSPVDGLRYE